jgi:UDP-GlcNAc3NAcA epimerase
MKIVTVIGARPQFVKAAVVSRAMSIAEEKIYEMIVHTGQHFDVNMSEIFFSELGINAPSFNLGIGGGTHGQNTGRMIEKIEEVIIAEKPDWVLVYGDTDSTLAGALAAAKLHIPVAHVEAGLRSFNRNMPEEINRIVTDHVSSLLFAPTDTASSNLTKEGIAGNKVRQVGDVMYDAALFYGKQSDQKIDYLNQLQLVQRAYILATIHRAENTDNKNRLQSIMDGLRKTSSTIVWPMHPRAKKRLAEFDISVPSNVRIIDPVGYLDMVMLEKNARAIATDSGGVQKEAYFHKVPCVTLRDETEWLELVEVGANMLVGANADAIAHALTDKQFLERNSFESHLYGDGNTGARIAQSLIQAG